MLLSLAPYTFIPQIYFSIRPARHSSAARHALTPPLVWVRLFTFEDAVTRTVRLNPARNYNAVGLQMFVVGLCFRKQQVLTVPDTVMRK
jgi:hypothetical protein